VRPRWDAARAGFNIQEGSVAIADDVPSFAALSEEPWRVVTLHYRALADALALKRLDPAWVQTARAERRAGRQAALVLAYSERVGAHLGWRARYAATKAVPIAIRIPPRAVPAVEEPVAGILADWSWMPNRVALDRILGIWPEVARRVPGARLLVAGRSLDPLRVGHMKGVELVGEVARSEDVLSRTALVAFPCPNTSGPKVKVLEAVASGVCVLTTPAGVEGLRLRDGEGVVTTGMASFPEMLASLLGNPERRADLARRGREAAMESHSPKAAAIARMEALASSVVTSTGAH